MLLDAKQRSGYYSAAKPFEHSYSLASVLLRLIVSVPDLGRGNLFRARHGE